MQMGTPINTILTHYPLSPEAEADLEEAASQWNSAV